MTRPVAQAALDRALDEPEDLVLLYQPIHEARTRRIVAAEALLRQRRQSGELRETSIITETAEAGPELFQLDSIMMRTAFEDAARWQRQSKVSLNVNLSPREFEGGSLLERLEALLSRCGIDAHNINLEITETRYIEQPEETMEILDEFKRRGLHLWLDDFGTGHSSLEHVLHFPLDGLKIPGTFIKDIPNNPRCCAITQGLVRLAHDVGIEVVAEGIEREEQLDFLLEAGCDCIQGFLFSRPMRFEELQKAIATPPRSSRAARRARTRRAGGRGPSSPSS